MITKNYPFALELKEDDGARVVQGWASTFGNTDSDGDVIAPGAFTESLKGKMPKMLWQHRSDQPVGRWVEASENAQGLYVKGVLSKTQLGNDAYELLKDGAIDGISIGFAIQKYIIDNTNDTRVIQQVDLWEASLVTFPANTLARVTGVKNAHGSEREFEDFLREAGYSREAAKIITARGFKAVGGRRDAEADAHKELAGLFAGFTQQFTL